MCEVSRGKSLKKKKGRQKENEISGGNVCLCSAWAHGCSGIGQKWRQKFYNRRLQALFPDSKEGGKDEGGEETRLRAAGEWQDLAATPGVQH